MKRRSKKPWIDIDLKDESRISEVYDTYRELKKHLKNAIKKSYTDRVYVVRTRRGEWGQWFEIWELDENDKLIKTKETWL